MHLPVYVIKKENGGQGSAYNVGFAQASGDLIIFLDADDPYEWEIVTGDELPSAQWEHTFVMTEHGLEILTY